MVTIRPATDMLVRTKWNTERTLLKDGKREKGQEYWKKACALSEFQPLSNGRHCRGQLDFWIDLEGEILLLCLRLFMERVRLVSTTCKTHVQKTDIDGPRVSSCMGRGSSGTHYLKRSIWRRCYQGKGKYQMHQRRLNSAFCGHISFALRIVLKKRVVSISQK